MNAHPIDRASTFESLSTLQSLAGSKAPCLVLLCIQMHRCSTYYVGIQTGEALTRSCLTPIFTFISFIPLCPSMASFHPHRIWMMSSSLQRSKGGKRREAERRAARNYRAQPAAGDSEIRVAIEEPEKKNKPRISLALSFWGPITTFFFCRTK